LPNSMKGAVVTSSFGEFRTASRTLVPISRCLRYRRPVFDDCEVPDCDSQSNNVGETGTSRYIVDGLKTASSLWRLIKKMSVWWASDQATPSRDPCGLPSLPRQSSAESSSSRL